MGLSFLDPLDAPGYRDDGDKVYVCICVRARTPFFRIIPQYRGSVPSSFPYASISDRCVKLILQRVRRASRGGTFEGSTLYRRSLGAGTRICGNLDHPSFELIIMAFCFGAFCSERIPLMWHPSSQPPRGADIYEREYIDAERPCGPCVLQVYMRARVCKVYYMHTPYIRTSAPGHTGE